MKNAFLLAAVVVLAGSPGLCGNGAGYFVNAGPPAGHNGGGFAPPNAYGYAGSYTGGAGYSKNFGYNTMGPGNMPLQYYNGYGAYGSPYGAGYPAFGAPVAYGAAGGGFYTINYGGRSVRFWQGPTGYYYPWLSGIGAPTVYVPQAGQSPQAVTPPISTVCSDLLTYLDQQKEKGAVSADSYDHLKRRTLDIRNKERDLRIAGNGSLDGQDEASMRRDLESLGSEVAREVSP
jgi:hypothetical protein